MMMNSKVTALMFAFFAGSWLSNGQIIRTTTVLLETASLTLILAASSLAGLFFFGLLRLLGRWHRPSLAGALMLPMWGLLQALPQMAGDYPLAMALGALLLGELVKWHLYGQVLLNWGPMGAQRILAWAVLAYELGTIAAALLPALPVWVEILALLPLYAPFFMKGTEAESAGPMNEPTQTGPWTQMLPWLVACGMAAGFLKVSADTGFKYAVRLQSGDALPLVSQFYLVSAIFTLALGGIRRLRWVSPRMGCTQSSLVALGAAQIVFALALLTGNSVMLVSASALQRSVDKIFYQPTMQLMTSGFTIMAQERLRRWHVAGFLGLGSLLGLVAFAGHGLLASPQEVLWGISLMHVAVALGFFAIGRKLVRMTVAALDAETRRTGQLGGSRPMAMLALLSPRHFLVHALQWSNRSGGGMQALPQELVQGLVAEPGREVVQTFYRAFPRLEETQQLALIRLAAFMDLSRDREFLMTVALAQVNGSRRARRLAAHHLVKVLGKEARPLLRRARGKQSPLPKKAA